jgi:hypothetical protein
MKYYLYISATKVEMLFPQIGKKVQGNTEIEFAIDLKLLSASRKSTTETPTSLISKIEAIEQYLASTGDMGSCDYPGEFFSGELEMSWGPYWGSHKDRSTKGTSPVVYFGGATDETIVGLVGSSRFLLGDAGSASPFCSSYLGTILDYIRSDLTDEDYKRLAPFSKACSLGEWGALAATFMSTMHMGGTTQRLEFLAKRLAFGSFKGTSRDDIPDFPIARFKGRTRALLGTPLYVALAE